MRGIVRRGSCMIEMAKAGCGIFAGLLSALSCLQSKAACTNCKCRAGMHVQDRASLAQGHRGEQAETEPGRTAERATNHQSSPSLGPNSNSEWACMEHTAVRTILTVPWTQLRVRHRVH